MAMLVSIRVNPQPKNHQKPPYLRCNEENPSQGRGEGCKSQQEGCQDHLKNVIQGKSKTQNLKSKQKLVGCLLPLFVYECYARNIEKEWEYRRVFGAFVKLWDVTFRFSAHWRFIQQRIRFPRTLKAASCIFKPQDTAVSWNSKYHSLLAPTTGTITGWCFRNPKQPTWDDA